MSLKNTQEMKGKMWDWFVSLLGSFYAGLRSE